MAMYPDPLFLGQVYPRRPLYQAKRNLHGLLFARLGPGLYNVRPANPDHLWPAHELGKEMGTRVHPFTRGFVSHALRP